MMETIAQAQYREFKAKFEKSGYARHSNLLGHTRENVMPAPHKHAELIKAWADGAVIQVEVSTGWVDMDYAPCWAEYNHYRIKPEPAAPKWPQTTMNYSQLADAANGQKEGWNSVQAMRIANATIVHECLTGALVPADKVREIEAKARAEGEKISKERHRQVIWWALQDAGIFPVSDYLDDLVRRMPT